MTTHRELDRSISTWLEAEAPTRAPDDVLEASRERLRTTKQRRAWMPAWRYSPMNPYAKLAAAAAVVLVVGFVGYRLLPGMGGPGGQPTIAPSPTPSLLARGTFQLVGHDVDLNATGSGSNVAGTLKVTSIDNDNFTVALQCSRTIDGLLWIGGDVTESTSTENAPVGTRTAIVLKAGPPAEGIFVFQMSDPASASCLAFFDDMRKLGPISTEPITGTVQLGP